MSKPISEKLETAGFDKDSTLEQGPTDFVVQADERYHFDAADLDRVQRRLKQRHVQMYVFLLSLRLFSNFLISDRIAVGPPKRFMRFLYNVLSL
jgi:hypothetical protein